MIATKRFSVRKGNLSDVSVGCEALRQCLQHLEVEVAQKQSKISALREALKILEERVSTSETGHAQSASRKRRGTSSYEKSKPEPIPVVHAEPSVIVESPVGATNVGKSPRAAAVDEAIEKAPARFTARDIRGILLQSHPELLATMKGSYVTNQLHSRSKMGAFKRVGKAADGFTVVYLKSS